MSETPQHKAVLQRQAEIGVAVFTAVFGLVIIIGSLQVGVGWGVEGPKAGFFPFYIGLFIVAASIVNAIRVFPEVRKEAIFADFPQLKAVFSVFVPTAVYVALVMYIGIYISSMLLIALFMRWLGKFNWLTVLLVSIGVPVLIYFTFEKWFLVPLPKGPIEDFFDL
jgi:putative tricarboxylic transport membrane protein